MRALSSFREIWLVDTEYYGREGERPRPVCLVAREWRTGKTIRKWADELDDPPFSFGRDTLLVAYLASAEMGFFLSCGWPLPSYVLDLYAEFRARTNGWETVAGNSLLGAMAHFGLGGIDSAAKDEMRDRILRGPPFSREETRAILSYCESDVRALADLLPAMLPNIDFPRALLRGRYMRAVAMMEFHGTPIDMEALGLLRENWETVKLYLIEKLAPRYGVFEGSTFKYDRFEAWLVRHNLAWPRLDSGQLDLSADTFRDMSKVYPPAGPLHELRHTLSGLRLHGLAVGSDGRNRTMLSPFGATTGRNTPSNSKFIFGPATWMRFLIAPPPGYGIAYLDFSQEEFAIAANLSQDPEMLSAYESGDAYLGFAKQAGAVPEWATKNSHGFIRDTYKTCSLGVNYCMHHKTLAFRIGRPEAEARYLLQRHREIYRRFWKWAEAAVDQAALVGRQWTSYGWICRTKRDFNPRSLQNFPMQAEGAHVLQIACSLGIEKGIEICAPVHDAVLICAPAERLRHDVWTMRQCMAEASRFVLRGFEIRTSEPDLILHPNHYSDDRGKVLWGKVSEALERLGRPWNVRASVSDFAFTTT